MLILYHDWDSIQSTKVRFCLYEKGLAFDSQIVSLKVFENLLPSYIAINAQGVVPTLAHERKIIVESSKINEYLDGVGGGNLLLPSEPEARERVRHWCQMEDTVMHPAVRAPTFQLMIKQRYAAMTSEQMGALVDTHPLPERANSYRTMAVGKVDYAAVVDSIGVFRLVLNEIEESLQCFEWLAADDFTLADIAAAAFMDRLEALGLSSLWDTQVRIKMWVDALKKRPAYSNAMPTTSQRMPSPTESSLKTLRQHLEN